MRLTTSDGRFAIANFVSTFPLFCRHSSKFTCHPIFSVPDRKNRCRTSGIGCRKSESNTCKQPNINEKEGKIRCRKSAVRCRKPHTCVRTLRVDLNAQIKCYQNSSLELNTLMNRIHFLYENFPNQRYQKYITNEDDNIIQVCRSITLSIVISDILFVYV